MNLASPSPGNGSADSLSGNPTFQKIVVGLNNSPESRRAFVCALDLAVKFSASLTLLSVLADVSPFADYAIAVDPSALAEIREQQRQAHDALHEEARRAASARGLEIRSFVIEGREVKAVVDFLEKQGADLLVLGLHQHDFYIARLWNSVYDLALKTSCSILGIH
jgi:nucleotide-binding universal stress UspA family protein